VEGTNLVHGLDILPEERNALFHAVAARHTESLARRNGQGIHAPEEAESQAINCLNNVDGSVTVYGLAKIPGFHQIGRHNVEVHQELVQDRQHLRGPDRWVSSLDPRY
jgi:hypothetical protein